MLERGSSPLASQKATRRIGLDRGLSFPTSHRGRDRSQCDWQHFSSAYDWLSDIHQAAPGSKPPCMSPLPLVHNVRGTPSTRRGVLPIDSGGRDSPRPLLRERAKADRRQRSPAWQSPKSKRIACRRHEHTEIVTRGGR